MVINNIFKLIFIFLSFACSIILLFIILLYLYYINNNSFQLNNSNGYITKIASWYLDKEISFDRINIIREERTNKIAVEVKNFKTYHYNDFENISIDLVNFECFLFECIRGYKQFTNIRMLKPNIKYVYSNKYNFKEVDENYILNIIDNLEITNIIDGNVTIDYAGNISQLLNINYNMKEKDNYNNILGNFLYKSSDNINTTNFNFTILNSKNKKNIIVKFEKLNLTNLNVKDYPLLDFLAKNNDVNGEISFLVEQQRFQISRFKIYSHKGKFLLNQDYEKYFIIDKQYNYRDFTLQGYFNFQNNIFKIHDLNFIIFDDDDLRINLKIDGYSNFKDVNNLKVEINFYNYLPNKLFIFENKYLKSFVNNKLSGESSFNVVNNNIENLYVYIKDINLDNAELTNVTLRRKNVNYNNEVNFAIRGNIRDVLSLLQVSKIYNNPDFKTFDGDLTAKINLQIPINNSARNYKFDIKGNINGVEFNNKLVNDYIKEDSIDSLDFNINNYNGSEYLNIEDITLWFKSNKHNSFIKLIGNYKYHKGKHNLDVNSIFNNININQFVFLKFNHKLFNFVSGESKFEITNSMLNDISIRFDNIARKNLLINNLNYKYNPTDNISEILFNINGDIEEVINIFNQLNLEKKYEYLKHNKYKGYMDSDMQIKLNKFKFIDAKINGKIKNFSKYSDEKFIDYVNIKSIDEINFHGLIKNNNINLTGISKIDNKVFQYSYSEMSGKKIFYTNFLMDNEFRKLLNFNKNLIIGDSNYFLKILNDDDQLYFDVEVDYINAEILLNNINFYKPYNQKSGLNISGKLNNKFKPYEIDIKYRDEYNNLHAGIKNINDNKLDIEIMKFIFDKNNLSGKITYNHGNYYFNINGNVLNLGTFLNINGNNNYDNNIFINAKVDKLIILDDVELKQSNIYYKYENRLLNKFTINSKYFGDEELVFRAESDLDNINRNKYSILASDAGKFFKTLNYETEINDGVFSSEGYFGVLDDDYDIMGTISIDNFKIMKTPIFAELLLAASLTGLIELLENDGIEFEQFDVQFFGKKGIYKIHKSRAYGFSLGITGEGTINTNDNSLDIKGALIPAYKINTVFNNIPLIGEIISGKEDEGLFAINYITKGNWDNLESEINPISVLTPGLLRNIFDFLE